MVARRICEILINSQIPLRCGQGRVTIADLDLFDARSSLVGQLAVCPPQIMRGGTHAELLGTTQYNGVDRGGRHALSDKAAAFVYFPQHQPSRKRAPTNSCRYSMRAIKWWTT